MRESSDPKPNARERAGGHENGQRRARRIGRRQSAPTTLEHRIPRTHSRHIALLTAHHNTAQNGTCEHKMSGTNGCVSAANTSTYIEHRQSAGPQRAHAVWTAHDRPHHIDWSTIRCALAARVCATPPHHKIQSTDAQRTYTQQTSRTVLHLQFGTNEFDRTRHKRVGATGHCAAHKHLPNREQHRSMGYQTHNKRNKTMSNVATGKSSISKQRSAHFALGAGLGLARRWKKRVAFPNTKNIVAF